MNDINIPIQVFCMVDTNGKLHPLKFRYENEEHLIETVFIDEIISRDEKHYVGIREKQFVCTATFAGTQKILELRYHVDSQRWRIFRFLS